MKEICLYIIFLIFILSSNFIKCNEFGMGGGFIPSNNKYPVSKICSDQMTSMVNGSNANGMNMIMWSGIGYNELGNFDSCINLNKNVSQYCLYDNGVKIGVCYPSKDYCSKQDILGLMSQYTILSLLSMEMNLTVDSITCFDNSLQTPQYNSNAGTWIMTIVCCLFGAAVLIGTTIEYILILKKKKTEFGYLSSENKQEINSNEQIEFHNETIINNNNSNLLEEPFYFNYLDLVTIDSDKILIKIFLCFSIIKNYKSLVHSNSVNGSQKYFDVLDGIRSFSTMWVILGHSLYIGMMGMGYDNLMYLLMGPTMKTFQFQAIMAGVFAVDTFFFLSGFLVVHSLLGYFKRNQVKNLEGKVKATTWLETIKFWSVYVLHRFLRLSPLYYFLIFFSMFVIPLMGSGPTYNFSSLSCPNYSWVSNLFYVSNLFVSNSGENCFSWAWYMNNDMQFFLITPFILVLYKRKKFAGWLLVAIMLLTCWLSSTIVYFKKDISMSLNNITNPNNQEATVIYQYPWNRIGAYLIGISLAFIHHDKNLSKKLMFYYHSRIYRYLIYLLSFGLLFFIIFIPYTNGNNGVDWNLATSSVYNGFSHSLYVFALAVLLFGCFNGYGGIMNWFLKLKIWKFYSKLTYSSYLVHPIVMMYKANTMTNFSHYSFIEFTYLFFGNLISTLLVSIIIFLLIEKPFINLERLIF